MMLIDLTHPLQSGQPAWPGDPPLLIEPAATVAREGYNVSHLSMGTHQGTHLDAPRHFFDDGQTVDQLDLARLCGEAHLIDLAPGSSLPPSTMIGLDLLLSHAGRFLPGGRVLYRTGWSAHFGRPEFFENVPSLSVDAARWIADRGIVLLGMDTPTPSEDLDVHRILLAKQHEVIIVESMANLDLLPPGSPFTLLVLPLKLAGAVGAPVRAVAMISA